MEGVAEMIASHLTAVEGLRVRSANGGRSGTLDALSEGERLDVDALFHGLNDIAFSAPLNPRGPYDPDETYREGDMVTLPNGSQWLFVGTTPAKGSAPAGRRAAISRRVRKQR